MANILVVTPTYQRVDGSDAIHPLCIESIVSQQFDGYMDWHIGRHNPYKGLSHKNVLAQYQMMRRLFLAGAWDALVTIEHDNVLTDNGIVQRMYDTKADVVYAPYLLRHNSNVLNTWRYEGDRNLGMSLSLYPQELAAHRRDGVGRISGCGMGCTLFRRHTLELLEFRQGDGDAYAPDIPFAIDALHTGFISMGRFDAPVLHIEGDIVMHPYEDGLMDNVRVLALQSVVALVNEQGMRLVAGESYELPRSAAVELQRAGYVAHVALHPETPDVLPFADDAPKAKRGRKAKA